MNVNDYQAFCVQLASPSSDLATAAIGICDECIELYAATDGGGATKPGILKELGDVFYYVAFGADKLGTTFAEIAFRNGIDAQEDALVYWGDDQDTFACSLQYMREALVKAAGQVAGSLKKVLYHGHPINGEYIPAKLSEVIRFTVLIAAVFGITTQEIIDANVTKLRARYGERFSEEKSLHRVEGV